jgi:hypothetical protein
MATAQEYIYISHHPIEQPPRDSREYTKTLEMIFFSIYRIRTPRLTAEKAEEMEESPPATVLR